MVNTFYLELAGTQKVIIGGAIKINNLDSLSFATFSKVLLYRQVINQHLIEGMIVFHQSNMLWVSDLTHNLAQVLFTNPWIQITHGNFKAANQHHLINARTFS